MMSRRRTVLVAVAVGVLLVTGTALSGALSGITTRANAATTAGCGKAPTLTSGTKTIQSSGQNRTYILDIPTNYDRNRPYRLIFGLHWLNGTASNVATGGSDGAVWAFYGQKQLSNNGTIFVAPQGINNGWANTNGQDITLVDNILSLVERRPVRRDDAGLRHGLELRRRDELRAGLRPARGLPGGRGLLRRPTSADAAAAPSPSPTSASTAPTTASSTSPTDDRCGTPSSATTAAQRRARASRPRAA